MIIILIRDAAETSEAKRCHVVARKWWCNENSQTRLLVLTLPMGGGAGDEILPLVLAPKNSIVARTTTAVAAK